MWPDIDILSSHKTINTFTKSVCPTEKKDLENFHINKYHFIQNTILGKPCWMTIYGNDESLILRSSVISQRQYKSKVNNYFLLGINSYDHFTFV